MIDLKTRAVAPFFPDARTFHNIYKLQKHVLLRHQSYLIVLWVTKIYDFGRYCPFKLLFVKNLIGNKTKCFHGPFLVYTYQHVIKVILHQFWVKKCFPENSIWNTAVPLLSYSCMFQVEICSQQLEICKSVCMSIILAIVVETD